MGPSKADESFNWRSAKSSAPPRRAAPVRRDPPPRRDAGPDRDPPKFGGASTASRAPDRPSFRDRAPPERNDARPERELTRGGFGSALASRPGGDVRRSDGPDRSERRPEPARRSYDTRPERPAPRDDTDFGSFRNRSGPPPRANNDRMGDRMGDRMDRTPPRFQDGPRDRGVAPAARREAPEFRKDAAEQWKKDQEYQDGIDERERESKLVEGTTKITAAPLNAWGGRSNPITGPRPNKPAQRSLRSADSGETRPREPPQRLPRRTRYSGTPSGFGYELVQRLAADGPRGRVGGGGQRPAANSRFARPADDEFRGRDDGRRGFRDEGRGGLPSGPSRNDRREGEVQNLNQRRVDTRGPMTSRIDNPRSGSSPPKSAQNTEAFPSLPDAPKHEALKPPVDTRKVNAEAKRKKRVEEDRKRREEDEQNKKIAQQNLLRSQDFVKALGEEAIIAPDILQAGLAVITEHPDLTLDSKYGTLLSALKFKVAVHDPDLPSKKTKELLSTCLAVTLMEKGLDAVELFGTLSKFITDTQTVASLAETTFKYILKRKGETKLVALLEGMDVMALLSAPEDRDDWDDFLDDKGLICLAPPEDFGEQVATALENNEPPSEVLEILADAEDGKIPASTCKQIVVYLADLYIKSGDAAEKFVDGAVAALFKKVAAAEEMQIMAINEIINRWYEAEKKKGQFILFIKALHEKELIKGETLVEWKDQKGKKAKQQALLDSYEEQQIGGVEIVNMSDYVTKHDPANQRKNLDEESGSESEDEVVNDYLGADPLNAHMANEAIPEDDYGDWSD